MMKPVPVRSWKISCVAAALTMVGGSSLAFAQPTPPPPPLPPAAQAPYVPPAEAAPSEPALAGATAAPAGATDHDSVVGLWGVEARRLGTFARTPGEDVGCGTPCTVDLNSVGVRKWMTSRYAYSVGLGIAAGGGSRRGTGSLETFDTYLGAGPTVSASFLLASWKHLAVSLSPQLDFVFFLPSSAGSKSYLVNLRGLIEGEVHLGMIGLPQASVGLSTGLAASLLHQTSDNKPGANNLNAVAYRWSVGLAGQTSLWDLVTNASLRYYF